MESIKSRLQRRAALRRAVPEVQVDAQALRGFWLSLDADARFEALRFEDPALVQRLHEHMASLCRAELWSFRNITGGLVRGASEAGEGKRLEGFGFERPTETDCIGRQVQGPTAFCATPEFAESDRLLEDLERQLGSPLLDGRPVLHPKDWINVVEATPSSWQELQLQALRLVELAVFQAHAQGAQSSSGAQPPDAAQSAQPADEQHSGPFKQGEPAAQSQSAKRRARRKRMGAAMSQLAEEEEEGRTPPACTASGDAPRVSPGDPSPSEGVAEGAGAAAADARRESPGSHQDSQPLRSAWLPNFVRGEAAQWQLVTFRPRLSELADGPRMPLPVEPCPTGLRAVVKNTFLDLEIDKSVPRGRRSCIF